MSDGLRNPTTVAGHERLPGAPPESFAERLRREPMASAGGWWLIWSHEHDAWWKPNACGYTREKWEAEEAAFAVAQRTGGDGQFRAARAGTAKAYHRYQVGREKAA